MRRSTQALGATMVGAVIGGLAGYVLFSETGRAWRRQLGPQIEDLIGEFQAFRGTIARASSAAGDGWRLLTDAMQEPSATDDAAAVDEPFTRTRQSHPL